MFPQSGATEVTKDQVMIQVFPGVQNGHAPKDTKVRLQGVVRPGPHHSPHINNYPYPFFLGSSGIGMYGSPPKYPLVRTLLDPLKFLRPAPLLLGP